MTDWEKELDDLAREFGLDRSELSVDQLRPEDPVEAAEFDRGVAAYIESHRADPC